MERSAVDLATYVRTPLSAFHVARLREMSDIVITVFAARRRRLIESGQAGLTLIGPELDRAVRRVEAFAAQNRIPYRAHALGSTEARDAGPALWRAGRPRRCGAGGTHCSA